MRLGISLSTRITLAALLLVLAGGLLWINKENDQQQRIYLSDRSADLETALHVEKVRLGQSIETLRQDVVFLANTPPISGIVRASANYGLDPRDKNSYATWEARLQEIFAAFLRAHPEYYQVRYIGAAGEGMELVRVERRDGRVEVIPHDALQSRGGRDYFRAGLMLTAGRVHLSEFDLDKEMSKGDAPAVPTLRAVTTVFDASGRVFGMVVINKDMRTLFDSSSSGLPPAVKGYVTDQKGRYLLHHDAKRAFAFEAGPGERITDDFPTLAPLFEEQTKLNKLPFHAVNAIDAGYLAAERVFFDAGDPSRFLLLAYHVPAQMISKQVSGIPLPNILDAVAVMLALGAVFMLMLRYTFAPLRRITAAAREIAAGNRDIRLPKNGGGEVRELSEALNIMLDKLLESDLIERENAFRKELIESLPGAFYMLNADGRFLLWNHNLEQVLQRSREEIASSHPLDFFAGADKTAIGNAIRQAFEQGEVSVEAVLLAKDGSGTPFHFTGRRVMRLGAPVLIGLGLDIAAQRESVRTAEALLRRNESLMQNSMEGIHVLDIDGNVLDVNEGFCRMLGYTREEAMQLNVSDWDGQFSAEELRARIRAFIGKSDTFETVHRRKDGSQIDVEICATGAEIGGVGYLFASSRDVTERKKAQSLLLRYQRVIETAMDGYWVTGASGVLEEVNEAYARISGYSMQELVGMHISQLEASERPEDVAAHIEKIIAQGYDRFETRHRRKDGRIVDIEVAATFMQGSEKFFVFCHNITHRKQAEIELKHSQTLLNEAQHLGKFGSWELDLLNGVLYWSDETYRIFEVAPALGALSYEMFLNMVHPDDRDMVNQAYLGSLRNREQYDMVHRLQFADGRIKWLREHCNTEFDGASRPLRSVGMVQDITEQRLAEEAMRVAAAAFETQDAIVITDAQSNIVRVNRAFTAITGYSAAEVIGRNPRLMSSGRHDKEFYAAMWQQLLESGSWAGEIWDRRKNGEVYPKWLTITAVKDEYGETTQYVAIFSDITARKQAEEEIRNLAFYDALTQLPNRRLFQERFHSALLASARYEDYGAILFIDLDRFKMLNDTLGHDYGDMLLVEVAARIQACVREMDTVARMGGDEFVVLLEGVSDEREDASHKAGMVAEKIREALDRPYQLKEHEHYSSPSIGISLYHGADESMDALLKHADAAMYQAKNAGRNAVRFYDPNLQQDLETRATLENDLRRAIENRELHLYYQVQVDNDHHPVGVEALIRWIHPQRGLVSPARFIPIAEDSSLILEIGNWVLETACAQLAEWGKDERMAKLTLAINVSAHQFHLHDFVEQVAAALHRHHVEPSRLKLELTEGVVLNDLSDVVTKMLALKGLGVQLSLDDFGTGYSSLSYLKRLPLDQLKIDRSFIRDITVDPGDAGMVQSIIDMAKNFKQDVIAEGVETEAQLAFLKHHDCQAYQGFFFSKPLPEEELRAMMDKLS
ncbi:MAG: PAS domain S-box protein [Nitrosomonadales bacterium]|nr:PAS domain S-box protein [Nitrosomonadales bacterium]